MPRFADLHAEEAELTRRIKLSGATPALEAKLEAVRKAMAQHHDRLFGVDTSDEAVSRRLGLPYTARVRPGSDFTEEDIR